MKKLYGLVVILLAFMVSGCAGTPTYLTQGAPPFAQPGPLIDYSNNDYDFSIKYPQDWGQLPKTPEWGNTSIVAIFDVPRLASDSTHAIANMAIEVTELSEAKTGTASYDEYSKQWLALAADTTHGYHLVSSRYTTLGGFPAYQVIFTQSSPKYEEIRTWALVGTKVYILTGDVFRTAKFDDYLPTFQAMLGSFQVTLPSFLKLRASALTPSYQYMFRNIENYTGKTVYYQGQVNQVVDNSGGSYRLRVFVTPEAYGWNDDVILDYTGPRILENDLIEFVGSVQGPYTYTTVMGASRTIPLISVIQLKLSK